MRQNAKVDGNQAEIVAALRAAGCTVTLLHRVGRGVPDLLVGVRGSNLLIECKLPGEKLTPAERHWLSEWRGQATIVYNVEDALRMIAA